MNPFATEIDLVDKHGQIIKQNIPRNRSRAYPDLYAQVVIVVLFDRRGRVLVHKRKVTKTVNPGDIDFVCGMVDTGETPLEAAVRESIEETGLHPENLRLVHQSINSYRRYRYLFVGTATGKPQPTTDHEVEWVKFLSREVLARSDPVVDEFYEDLARVEAFLRTY